MLEGPGIITHIWMTSHAGWANELNALSIRIYWDGRKEPAVEAPLGDFFAVGQGKPAVVESFPVQVSPTGALTCFWRMPFAKSARIVIRNDNPDRGAGLYWQIDWVQVDRLPKDVGYFHAKYRQEYPAKPGDYLIADLAGRGQYVGTVMSRHERPARLVRRGGRLLLHRRRRSAEPSGDRQRGLFQRRLGAAAAHRATGSARRERRARNPATAAPAIAGTCSIRSDSTSRFAWRSNTRGTAKRIPRRSIWSGPISSAASPSGIRPASRSRLASCRRGPIAACRGSTTIWSANFCNAKTTGGKLIVEAQGFFGARPLLRWRNREVGARLTLPFTVAEDGKYALRLSAMQDPAYGLYTVFIDKKKVGEADFRGPEENELDLPLGTRRLKQGEHKLIFEAKSISAPGQPDKAKSMTVEALRLLKLPKKAVREVKTDNEAHFVRLGIGRSLYAYRLVYGKLPDSLEEMVKAGIMPKKYLKDENDVPLKAWREGDYMVVQSVGPVHWKHQWTGLDPRR